MSARALVRRVRAVPAVGKGASARVGLERALCRVVANETGYLRHRGVTVRLPRATGNTVEDFCRALERLGLMVTTVCVDVARPAPSPER